VAVRTGTGNSIDYYRLTSRWSKTKNRDRNENKDEEKGKKINFSRWCLSDHTNYFFSMKALVTHACVDIVESWDSVSPDQAKGDGLSHQFRLVT
jgi:hypothetical protein